jgi:hypothetical protein
MRWRSMTVVCFCRGRRRRRRWSIIVVCFLQRRRRDTCHVFMCAVKMAFHIELKQIIPLLEEREP